MKNNTKTSKTENRKPAKKATRSKILKAARKVFAQYAYHAASIRMIGKKAGVDHPLISYYFPSKAVLFEAVLADIMEEWQVANAAWSEGIDLMSPEKGLSLYIDRVLDFSRKRPYAAQVLMLNMVQAQDGETIPGYHAIQTYFEESGQLLKSLASARTADSEIEKFRQSFFTLAMSYVGARSYYAGILGMPPNSREYKEWVKGALMDLFLPRLKQLMFGQQNP
jgi:TetR/AcrR family transcriptional regulator